MCWEPGATSQKACAARGGAEADGSDGGSAGGTVVMESERIEVAGMEDLSLWVVRAAPAGSAEASVVVSWPMTEVRAAAPPPGL